MPFKDRFKGPFKGPFKGRNKAASAEQLEVMQSYNSQETTIFFCEKPKVCSFARLKAQVGEKHLLIWNAFRPSAKRCKSFNYSVTSLETIIQFVLKDANHLITDRTYDKKTSVKKFGVWISNLYYKFTRNCQTLVGR